MFAVGAAHYCVFADLHAVGYKSSLDNRAGFHFHAGHQDAVDNLGAFTYCRTGKEYGVGNFAFYDTALSDECLVDLGVRSDILRKGRCIFRVDLPGGIVQVKLVVAVQKIHICFPEGIDGSYIFPVAFIFVCYQSFSWPVYDEKRNFPEAEKAVAGFQEAVRGVRNIRTEMNVPMNRKTGLVIVGKDAAACERYEKCKNSFVNLAFSNGIHVQGTKDGVGEDAVSVVVSDAVVYLPLEDLVDREKEIERLKKEQERLKKEIARCEGMLNNPNFVNKAPAAKVEAEKEKLQKYEGMMEKVNLQLKQMDK